jgi:hypothetical protein
MAILSSPGILEPSRYRVDGMRGLETIESAFARRKCALVSSPDFGGTGISGVTAEFLQGEMNAKKREQPVGHQNWWRRL